MRCMPTIEFNMPNSPLIWPNLTSKLMRIKHEQLFYEFIIFLHLFMNKEQKYLIFLSL